MKNIHILPTDKPSRLAYDFYEKFYLLSEDTQFFEFQNLVQNRELYITSNEEIKEGDWFYLDMSHSNALPDEIHQMGNDKWSKTGGIHFCEGNTWVNSCKKIILTTDQDLIKDGVQAIDDEFLEWICKNPSCEGVQVEWLGTYTYGIVGYKIIIPKEEPKQELHSMDDEVECNNCGNIMSLTEDESIYVCYNSECTSCYEEYEEEPKQETLEEAAERFTTFCTWGCKKSFIEGAKWQQQFNDTSEVTRVEVIQYSEPYNGRAYTNYDAKEVDIQFQDRGKTLKIFLK